MTQNTSVPSAATRRPVIVAPGEGETFTAFGDTIQAKLGLQHTGGNLALGLCTTEPGNGPPPHVHHKEDELFIIVEGTMSFWTNNQWRDVGPGGVVFLPRDVPHTFKNRSGSTVRMWVLTAPSGFEVFFSRCAEICAAGGANGPDMAQIMQIAAEHGIEFLHP